MKFRPITIRKDDKIHYSFNPAKILKVSASTTRVTVTKLVDYVYKEEKVILYKKDYLYSDWSYFVLQLNRVFEL